MKFIQHIDSFDPTGIRSNPLAKYPHEYNIMSSMVVRNPEMSNNGPN
jgi:hypothetical protein